MNEFEEFLKTKKIDPQKFQKGEPDRYAGFQQDFATMHPASFTARKLFLINKIRRTYLLDTSVIQEKPTSIAKVKPKISPKPKI
ncbi:MAG: hypothetical protein OEY56_02610 [Cyclobacteriaceae bacterium]|nr:hypothetical protein [Cyclobacteriaceae bacterium]